MVTEDDGGAVWTEFVKAGGDVPHRDLRRSGDCGDLYLPGLPNVEQEGGAWLVTLRGVRINRDLGWKGVRHNSRIRVNHSGQQAEVTAVLTSPGENGRTLRSPRAYGAIRRLLRAWRVMDGSEHWRRY